MKITLKNIIHYPEASSDSECFIASLFVNGKKIGVVKDSGDGI
ncbi:MAG: hypothetical protein ACJAS1_000550 [Oleiphilaceae bacterium]|jgi:hypothetical protein